MRNHKAIGILQKRKDEMIEETKDFDFEEARNKSIKEYTIKYLEIVGDCYPEIRGWTDFNVNIGVKIMDEGLRILIHLNNMDENETH